MLSKGSFGRMVALEILFNVLGLFGPGAIIIVLSIHNMLDRMWMIVMALVTMANVVGYLQGHWDARRSMNG